jgi:anti-sigma28 factor (negative regulator of flagellin synthesis)
VSSTPSPKPESRQQKSEPDADPGSHDEGERRIAELRERIQNGTYTVDALELSRKIIEDHIVRD